jgi:hypothetical protein
MLSFSLLSIIPTAIVWVKIPHIHAEIDDARIGWPLLSLATKNQVFEPLVGLDNITYL